MQAFIRGLPKAELHVHVEGCLEPDLLLALARRNRVNTGYQTAAELRRSYRFENLQSFLDLYYRSAAVLRTARDFEDLTNAYFTRARAENVRHAEIFFDPQTHTERGLPFEAVVTGIQRAREAGQRRYGITSQLILCFLRHLSPAKARQTLEQALPFKRWIVGVGLDSSEAGNPPAKFVDVFALARREGFRVVAHAGEEGPPDYIRQALDLLGAERIDHGVRAIEDAELVRRLVGERVPLTVCPLSNLRLGVYPSMEVHPLKRLLDAGVMVTVNSDDPAYFGGYVGENYLAAARALGLGRDALCRLAANSFEAAFVGEDQREAWKRELADYAASR